jgi:hypothetical protein
MDELNNEDFCTLIYDTVVIFKLNIYRTGIYPILVLGTFLFLFLFF